MTEQKKKKEEKRVVIAPLNMSRIRVTLAGTSPLVINHFGKRALGSVLELMTSEASPAEKKKRPPKDLEADFKDAQYVSYDGWRGLNASSIRNACISACRVADYAMTRAKLSVFVEADGYDKDHDTPLLQIFGGDPKMFVANVRIQKKIDIRARPMWTEWEIRPMMEFDADQFHLQDMVNLLHRAGRQVGLGEGRHDSRDSGGIGFGCFTIKKIEEVAA